MKKRVILLSVVSAIAFTACGSDCKCDSQSDVTSDINTNTNGDDTVVTEPKTFATKEKLGESLFFDQNISKTRSTSCATCHDPDNAFVDKRFSEAGRDQAVFIDGALSVGDDGSSLGGRNAPTAAYAMFSPAFDVKTVKGGQFHDGRASELKDQAMGPPLDPAEMQMPDEASVVERIKESPKYVASFKKLYGENIFDDVNASYTAMGEAIGKFEKTEQFAPFDSKYDNYLSCLKDTDKNESVCFEEGKWNDSEQRGMKLFFSKEKTSCSSCHQSKAQPYMEHDVFTNFEYHNIGRPQNFKALQARVDVGSATDNRAIDHGVYGVYPEVGEEKDGSFKVPTMRNIAVTSPYMTNGVFSELKTVIQYNDHMGKGTRPTNPETNQPWGEPEINATINPLVFAMPPLSDENVDDIEAFLKTLTDKKYEHLLEK